MPAGSQRSFTSGVTTAVAQQLLSGLLPFGFHVAAKNRLRPDQVAVGTIQFHLLQSATFSCCRDGIRRASLRSPSGPAAARLAWAASPAVVLAFTCLTAAFAFIPPTSGKSHGAGVGYLPALAVCWLAFLCDSAWEPLLIRAVFNGRFAVEATSEIVGRLAEAVTLWSFVCLPKVPRPAALGFACGRLAYSVLAGGVLVAAGAQSRDEAQGREASAANARPQKGGHCASWLTSYAQRQGVEPSVMQASVTFTWQASQKMMLQEATRFAMASYSSHVAGIYGEVHNMGSLVVRLVFWPIETTAFRVFSAPVAGKEQAAARGTHRDSSMTLFKSLHRLVLLVALIAFAFGPPFSFAAVHLLLSGTWSATEAPHLLSVYSGTLALLASNGMLEAFSHARMSNAQLARANGCLLAVTCGQMALMCGAHAIGDDARILLAIDGLAMMVRIVYSLTFVRSLPGGLGSLLAWLPSPASLGALGSAHAILRLSDRVMMASVESASSERLPLPMMHHLVVGAVTLLALIPMLAWTERRMIRGVLSQLKSHSD